jgi:NTP pyrophosphatase (non-canonical NTP hydrolase)
MSDNHTTVAELRQLVNAFVDRRDWHQFHAPKNLAMSLAIEAAELMEHFQWISTDESRRMTEQPEQISQVADELADVFCYLLAMANELNLDLSTAVRHKMAKNEQKYPADQFHGRAK